ncbi:hypothetical protein [Agrobacterium larrymoorei]|uniref:Uncharacterized protein n=1 Tax=Agrobacterium larrymoorei TaxID=160699 RepID=A0ABU0UID7_9HYPH|nr:hypothetical protein [Agrobacterium larrymoorei]MDQ1184704.1 hypothetical protein [Agrobacterium larrymoorei]
MCDQMDLFAWAASQPPPPSKTAKIINKVKFFRRKKNEVLAIFYANPKALLRPASGEIIDLEAFKQRRAEQSATTASTGRATA